MAAELADEPVAVEVDVLADERIDAVWANYWIAYRLAYNGMRRTYEPIAALLQTTPRPTDEPRHRALAFAEARASQRRLRQRALSVSGRVRVGAVSGRLW